MIHMTTTNLQIYIKSLMFGPKIICQLTVKNAWDRLDWYLGTWEWLNQRVEGFVMEEVKRFFAARGIGTSELAKGLVIHEVWFYKKSFWFKIFCWPYLCCRCLGQLYCFQPGEAATLQGLQPGTTRIKLFLQKNNKVKVSWLQADGRPQNQEEYTMGESSAEDQSLSPRLKNI